MGAHAHRLFLAQCLMLPFTFFLKTSRMSNLWAHVLSIQCLTTLPYTLSPQIPRVGAHGHRSFLVLWLAALPFIFAPEMHWWAIGVCVVVGYQLLGFEEIGVEIESPFGTDDVRRCPSLHLRLPAFPDVPKLADHVNEM